MSALRAHAHDRTVVARGGRPRDERATAAIVAAALRQLSEEGYARMSMESVAEEAGVSRATLYRRYRDKADLVTAAIATAASPRTGKPGADVVADITSSIEELDARFAESCLEVIGCLLAAREDPDAMALHRRRVVEPRMAALRVLVARAADEGRLREDVDVDVVLHTLTGAVFARRIAGIPPEPGWARRAVAAFLAPLRA